MSLVEWQVNRLLKANSGNNPKGYPGDVKIHACLFFLKAFSCLKSQGGVGPISLKLKNPVLSFPIINSFSQEARKRGH